MRSLLTHLCLCGLALVSLSSCISEDEQFHNTTVPGPAQLSTKNSNLFSAAYGRGMIVVVMEIDGKTTDGNWLRVPEPYLLSPGKHQIAAVLAGSFERKGFLDIEYDFKSKNTYVLRGRTTGGIFQMDVVNTTGGREVVEKSFKTVGQMQSSTMIFVPVTVH